MEATIEPLLVAFCAEHSLYLDKKGPRQTRKGKKKLTWDDLYENSHDLDFVLERNGSDSKIGEPVAFVELAWRRYTKHSRNKAQEIQGAILPLRDKHYLHCPFLGALLAGEFTEPSIRQLRSLGFRVKCIPYTTVVTAFASVGVDISTKEGSPAKETLAKVKKWEALTTDQKLAAYKALASAIKEDLAIFMQDLTNAVNRSIASIRILPLFGDPIDSLSIEEAISRLQTFQETTSPMTFVRFEVEIKFANDDKINANFASRERAIEFLKQQQHPIGSGPEGAVLVNDLINDELSGSDT